MEIIFRQIWVQLFPVSILSIFIFFELFLAWRRNRVIREGRMNSVELLNFTLLRWLHFQFAHHTKVWWIKATMMTNKPRGRRQTNKLQCLRNADYLVTAIPIYLWKKCDERKRVTPTTTRTTSNSNGKELIHLILQFSLICSFLSFSILLLFDGQSRMRFLFYWKNIKANLQKCPLMRARMQLRKENRRNHRINRDENYRSLR